MHSHTLVHAPHSLVSSLFQCQNYYYQFGEEIVSSKIILDDDLDFLCLQTPQIFVDIVRKDKNPNKEPQQQQQVNVPTTDMFWCVLLDVYLG